MSTLEAITQPTTNKTDCAKQMNRSRFVFGAEITRTFSRNSIAVAHSRLHEVFVNDPARGGDLLARFTMLACLTSAATALSLPTPSSATALSLPQHRGASRFFLDTADVREWEELLPLGIFHGVTTNPVLLERAGVPCTVEATTSLAKTAFDLGAREFMIQSWGGSADALESKALELCDALGRRSDDLVVKVPVTAEGTRAASALVRQGVRVCLTACYDSSQALVAVASGAEYLAPYVGRMSDAGKDGQLECVHMQQIVDGLGGSTRIFAASIRDAQTLASLAAAGLDSFTFSPAVARELFADRSPPPPPPTSNAPRAASRRRRRRRRRWQHRRWRRTAAAAAPAPAGSAAAALAALVERKRRRPSAWRRRRRRRGKRRCRATRRRVGPPTAAEVQALFAALKAPGRSAEERAGTRAELYERAAAARMRHADGGERPGGGMVTPLEAFAIMAEEDDIEVVDVGGDDGAPAIRGAWRDPLARMAALIADGDEWMPPARTVVLSCRKGDASAVALDLLTEHLRAAGSPARLLCVEGGCAAWQLNHLPMEEAAEAAV